MGWMRTKWNNFLSERKFENEIQSLTGYILRGIEDHAPRPKHVTMNLVKFSNHEIQGTPVYSFNNQLVEAVSYEFGAGERGGIVVFSTDVNAVLDGDPAESMLDKFTKIIKSKWQTLINRLANISKLDKVLRKAAKETDLDVAGYSVGNFFRGRFKSSRTGKVYDEKSRSVEIIGINSRQLLLLATEVAKEFKQESVLVKDHSSAKIYLADRRPVE